MGDGVGDDAADVGQAGEDGFGDATHGVEVAECGGQLFGGAFADVADAEGEQEAGERRGAALGDAVQDVLRPFGGGGFAVFDGLQFGDIQLINIGKAVQYVGGDEGFDLLVAQPGDVHGFAAGEVDKPLCALGLAEHAAGTAGNGFACFAFDRAAAHGAGFRQPERFVLRFHLFAQ